MRDLAHFEVLSIARGLVPEAYRLTKSLPRSEQFGLTSQIQRASVSIAANIAEGLGRGTQGDFERYLRIALGSAAELAVLIDLGSVLYEISESDLAGLQERVDELRRKLNRLVSRVSEDRQNAAS